MRWEGRPRGRGHTYTYGWFILIHGRNQHNIVKRLILQLKTHKNLKYSSNPIKHNSPSSEGKRFCFCVHPDLCRQGVTGGNTVTNPDPQVTGEMIRSQMIRFPIKRSQGTVIYHQRNNGDGYRKVWRDLSGKKAGGYPVLQEPWRCELSHEAPTGKRGRLCLLCAI